jgi:protocatechuate 3,4-dioxygenase beta subunit
VSPSERGPFDVQLKRAEGRLGGEVVDDRGAAVSGARVEIASAPMAPRWVTTDRSGRFRADGLGPGPYRVVVTHADFATGTFDDVAPADEARLQLSPGGGIDGEIRDARVGGVPPGVRLDIVSGGGKPRTLSVIGGRFRADALPPGRITLTASAPGYVTTTRELEIAAGDRLHDVTVRDLRIDIERGGIVTGRVRDDHGDPVVGVTVAVGTLRGRTDRDGNFRVEGVPPGRVRVAVDKGGSTAADDIEVRASDESRVDLKLR